LASLGQDAPVAPIEELAFSFEQVQAESVRVQAQVAQLGSASGNTPRP
jgi:hypothetical protein